MCCLLDFSDKPTRHFTKPDRRKRKLTKKDESPAEKPKVINIGSEILIERKWSYRKTSWLWNHWHTRHLRDARCSAEDLSNWELTDLNEESGCDQQDEVISEKVMLAKKWNIRGTLEIWHKSVKENKLKADLNLERSMTICQSIEKMFRVYCKLYDEEKASIIQTTLGKSFLKQKNKNLVLHVSVLIIVH